MCRLIETHKATDEATDKRLIFSALGSFSVASVLHYYGSDRSTRA